MSNYNTKMTFTAANDVDVEFKSARVSKAQCLQIGHDYFQADGKAQDEMLATLGGVLIRRSLLIFGNFARRHNNKDVADYVRGLRDEIKQDRAAVAV